MRRALIPARVLEQIQLMVSFCVPPLTSRYDLCDDLCSFGVKVLLLDFLCNLFGYLDLVGGVCEYGRAVFCECFSL